MTRIFSGIQLMGRGRRRRFDGVVDGQSVRWLWQQRMRNKRESQDSSESE